MNTQGIAITGTIHPQKSLSVVHICWLCAYRMPNMTICNQFDGVQDYLESIVCRNSQDQNSNTMELPLTVSYTPWSHYQNPRYAITMHMGDIIWQSASNLMPYDMNYNKFSCGIHRPRHNDDAMNSLYRYHPTPKVLISCQCMPTFFI
jgi:hypothetical protein